MTRRIAARFRPCRWLLCGMAVLVLFSVALNMVSPLLLREVTDRARPEYRQLLAAQAVTAQPADSRDCLSR